MRLVTFQEDEDSIPGLVVGDFVVNLSELGKKLGHEVLPDRVLDIIRLDDPLAQLQKMVTMAGAELLHDPTVARPLQQTCIRAPISRPAKNIFCLGLNYADHARESAEARGREAKLPQYPVFFTKAVTAVAGPYDDIVIDPDVSEQVDWEVELAVVIGRPGKNISKDHAMDHVFGYMVLNDVSARDLQSRHQQFFKGKSIDGYCPMGPWIISADEVPDPHNLNLQLRVNGVVKQSSTTHNLIFDIPTIIHILSTGLTLEAGDIIATGTPEGVGFARKPPEFLKPGDLMETEIQGIGTLRNHVRAI